MTRTEQSITLLNGAVRLIKAPHLPNPTEDAVWLAAGAPLPSLSRLNQDAPNTSPFTILDAGCGTGAVSLCYLTRLKRAHPLLSHASVRLIGLDQSPGLIEAFSQNAVLNGLGDMITAQTQTIATASQTLKAINLTEPFNLILSNPPYHPIEKGFLSPTQSKQHAHGTSQEQLTAWVNTLLALLAEGGTLCLILHTAQEALIQALLKPHGTGHITYLKTHAQKAAKRILLTFTKEKGAPQKPWNTQTLNTFSPALRQAILVQGEGLT